MKSSAETDRRQIRASAPSKAAGVKTGNGDVNAGRASHSSYDADIHNSPRQAAQRRRIDRNFGRSLQQHDNRTGLPDELKTEMETAYNSDFSDIRVHTASSKASNVGALAYTQGSDIHVAPGSFEPHTAQGRQLLGHEMAHVVQQREDRVATTGEVGGMPLNDDPVLEKEADEMADKLK